MDPTKMAPSFLTIIADEEPVFLTIPNDFSTVLWGDKVPYCKTVQIRDGNRLRMVRIRKRNGEPVFMFTDGWIMLLRDHGLKYKDVVLIKAVGPLKFEVSCFREFVCGNSYLTAHINTESGMSSTVDADVIFESKLAAVVGPSHVKPRSTVDADVIFESKLAAVYKAVEGNDAGIVSEDDLQGNSKDVKGKSKVDAGEVFITKNEYQTKRTLRSKTIVAAEKQCYDRPAKVQKVNSAPSIVSPVLNFTRVAEHRIRLPTDVSSVLDLSPGNLKEVRIQNLRGEVKKLMTRSEKHGKGFRYGLVGWSTYLKACKISFGVELFFEFHKSSKLLMLSKVVHKVKNKKSRA
ncbi:putative transcription factor B3-Domain family [Helianthus annuus]|nr:putative transcription factor B3-Domain family [Helianthus annuus]